MGSDVRHVRGEAQKELVRMFESFSNKGHSRWKVWSDWITMSAIAISNATDKSHSDEREKQYLKIVERYTKQELETFTDMLTTLFMALNDNPDQDFLGELYMRLELGSDNAGQFFTPYHVCEFMSALTTPKEEFQQKIEDRGWVAVCDPTCGAGALLVAFANQCKREGVNYQQKILFVAQDIDYIVGMMCYLQMSLLGMPGYVVIGDTLANPVLSYDSRGFFRLITGTSGTRRCFAPQFAVQDPAARMDLMARPIKTKKEPDTPKSEPQKAPEATKKPKKPKITEKPKAAKKPQRAPEQEPVFSGGQGWAT